MVIFHSYVSLPEGTPNITINGRQQRDHLSATSNEVKAVRALCGVCWTKPGIRLG